MKNRICAEGRWPLTMALLLISVGLGTALVAMAGDAAGAVTSAPRVPDVTAAIQERLAAIATEISALNQQDEELSRSIVLNQKKSMDQQAALRADPGIVELQKKISEAEQQLRQLRAEYERRLQADPEMQKIREEQKEVAARARRVRQQRERLGVERGELESRLRELTGGKSST